MDAATRAPTLTFPCTQRALGRRQRRASRALAAGGALGLWLGVAIAADPPNPPGAAEPRAAWRVGVETRALPLSDLAEDGRPLGYAVELLREIAAKQRADAQFVAKPWAELLEDFRAGKLDVLAAAVEMPERQAYMDFTAPHLVLSGSVFMRRGESVSMLARLRGRRIGALPQGPAWEYLQREGFTAELVAIPHLREGLQQLAARRLDAVLATRMIGFKIIREDHLTGIDASPIAVPGFAYSLCCAVPEGAEELRASLEAGLGALRADGTFMQIHEKWLGPYEPGWSWRDVRPFVFAGGAVLVAGTLIVIWQRRLLRRIAEQSTALRESEERHSLALEASGDGMWDWDIVKDHVVRDRRTAQLLGFQPHELGTARLAISGRAHPEDAAAVKLMRERLLAGEIGAQVEFRAETAAGEWRWFLVRGRVISRDAQGNPTRATGTFSDIHERKLAEEQDRRHRARLQEAQRLEGLGMLAGGVAHDFNNLLTVILGNAGLARQVLGPSAHVFLDPIEESGKRAAELCRQMLAYAGRATVQRSRIDLSHLVYETQHLLASLGGARARLRFEPGVELAGVEADVTQLRQVLVNLVMNAVEALPAGGGEILIATRREEVDTTAIASWRPECALPPGRYSCLEVRDRGSGIAPDVLPRVFEPFFTTKFTGRGLGLAAALGIARSSGGTITVESILGGGSTFRLWLPWREVAAETAPAAPREPARESAPAVSPPVDVVPAARPAAGGSAILVVDDEAVVRTTVVKLLGRFGFIGVEAAGGAEALALLRAEPAGYGAAVIDLTMPGLDGVETLTELRRLRPDLPVLLISGYSEEDVRERVPDAQNVAFLNKPFRPEELAAQLQRMV